MNSAEAVPPGLNRLLLDLDFGRGGNAESYQSGCWSHPEDSFTWALAPGCGIRLPVASSRDEIAFLVDVEPAWISHECKSRRAVVSLGTQILLDVQVSRRSVYLIAVGCFPEGALLDVLFAFDEVAPLDEREARPLALAFRTVLVIAQRCLSRLPMQTLPAIPLPLEKSAIPEAVEARTGLTPDRLVTAFESLGHSCDFGLFQRESGAEPLGLLRFSGISTPDLVKALVDRFARLGSIESVTASVSTAWHGEYMAVDHSYGLVSHTFLSEHQAAPEQVIARELWRLSFLKRLFLEVMDGGLKVFVLRRPDYVHEAEAAAVAAALRLHGDNLLLWAVQDEGSPSGSVDIIAPYLLRGHLDVPLEKGSSSIQSWLSVCINIHLAMRGREQRLHETK